MGDKRFIYLKDFYSGTYLGKRNLGFFLFLLITKIIPGFKFILLKAVRFLPSNIPSKRRKLLDIGCGNGEFMLRARYIGYEAKGIDFDPIAVKQSIKNDLNAECARIIRNKRNFLL